MLQTQKSSRCLFFSLITLSKNIGAKFYSHLEVWPDSNECIVSRVYRETICGIACDLSPPSPTGFQKQAKGGGQTDRRRGEQMGHDGLWQWNQASTGQEQCPIHHSLPRQIWKDRGRRAQEQGSKGEAKWGRNEKAWGGVGAGRVGRRAKRSDGVQKLYACATACVFLTLSLME